MARVTPIDRLISRFSPGAAARRVASRAWFERVASGARPAGLEPMGYVWNSPYEAANSGRMRKNQAHYRSRGVDEDSGGGFFVRNSIVLECLDLYRNHPIIPAAIARANTYAVWKGIRPHFQTSDPVWNREAADFFNQVVWKSVDFRERPGVDMGHVQRLVLSSRDLMGGCGFIKLADGGLQPVETQRIQTPERFKGDDSVKDGVRFDSRGRALGYFICQRGQGGAPDLQKFDFVPARSFIAAWQPWRWDQFHGIPGMHMLVTKVRDYADTDEYTLAAAKSEAQHIGWRKRDLARAANERPGGMTELEDSDGNKTRVEQHEFGMMLNLKVGEDAGFFDRKTPNIQHVPYMEHQLGMIGAARGIPKEILMMMFGKSSFSSLLAADMHAHNTFEMDHRYIVDVFLNYYTDWRLALAMDRGELRPAPLDAGGASEWWKKEWSLPPSANIQPGAQAGAESTELSNGSTSLSRIIAKSGTHRSVIFTEQEEDISDAIARANRINEKFPGANVTWRDFMNPNKPGAAPSGAAADPGGGKDGDDGDDE